MQEDLFITSTVSLDPADAVAALLVDEGGGYFLQLRDNLPHIFFPNHWGCFGGAINAGEAPLAALSRELREELELEIDPAQVKFFTRFEFDFVPMGKPKVYRMYYEVTIADRQASRFRLHEGQDFGRFSANELLLNKRVTPYDAFAIWMHLQAGRATKTAEA